MNAEIAIRGGPVVDGTGCPPVRADVGIADGRFVELGPRVTAADGDRRVGRLVVPGFIDIHTHYDPQVLWDPWLTPSSWHGVTTVVAGNCGYSIAPTRAAEPGLDLRTLDKVEDMRLSTLEAGVRWDFETYPEYLADRRPPGTAINFGGYVGHTPVRIYVMGDEAYERKATAEEMARMRQVVRTSLLGGALGFSSDRGGFHWAMVAARCRRSSRTQDELEALMGVTAEIGQGMVHVAPGERYPGSTTSSARLGRTITWSAILTYPEGTASGPLPGQAAAPRRGTAGRRRRLGPGDLPSDHPLEFSVHGADSLYRAPGLRRARGAGPRGPAPRLRRLGHGGPRSGAEAARSSIVPARWELSRSFRVPSPRTGSAGRWRPSPTKRGWPRLTWCATWRSRD